MLFDTSKYRVLLPDFPRLIGLSSQIAAAVRHAQDEQVVFFDMVDDPVVLKNKFAHVVEVGFRHLAPDQRKLAQLAHGPDDAL